MRYAQWNPTRREGRHRHRRFARNRSGHGGALRPGRRERRDRRPDQGGPRPALSGFEAPAAARGVQADVAKEADVARIVDEAVKAFGRIDILVNNAATVKLAQVEALDPADWQAMLTPT